MSCTEIENDHNFRCVSDTPGGDIMTTLYYLDKHGQLDSSTANGIVNSVVAYGYTTAVTQCSQSFVINQETSIECDRTNFGDLERFSDNTSCKKCKSYIAQIIKERQDLEDDAHRKNPKYKKQQAIKAARDLMSNKDDGVCQYVCMQCIARNVNQNISVNLVQSCDTSNNDFRTAFTTGMSYQAEHELQKHQNAMKGAGYQMQKDNDIQNMAIQMSDSITKMTKTSILNTLKTTALVIQRDSIESGSTSTVIQNAKQQISVSMFSSLTSEIYSDESLKNSLDYKNAEKAVKLEKSFSDLIKDLNQTVHTMEDLLTSLIGKILITVVALLLTSVFAFIFYFKIIKDDEEEE